MIKKTRLNITLQAHCLHLVYHKIQNHNETLKQHTSFDVLLTVHLSIFISVFNQLNAQNLFHNKFYFMPLHVSSTCAHHQEFKIALYSLWYHRTYRCDDTRGCVMQFWPPDDEHVCSKHVEAWNKTYVKQNFCASSWLNTEINKNTQVSWYLTAVLLWSEDKF